MKKIISVVGLGLALTFGGAALAENNWGHERGQGASEGGGHHQKMKRMFSKLDLTQEQEAAIKAIREESRDAMKANRQGFHDAMKAIIQAETFDETAFRAQQDKKADNRKEAGVIKAKMKNEVWNVLTPEQQAKLTEMMENRKERGGRGHRGGFRGDRDGGNK